MSETPEIETTVAITPCPRCGMPLTGSGYCNSCQYDHGSVTARIVDETGTAQPYDPSTVPPFVRPGDVEDEPEPTTGKASASTPAPPATPATPPVPTSQTSPKSQTE